MKSGELKQRPQITQSLISPQKTPFLRPQTYVGGEDDADPAPTDISAERIDYLERVILRLERQIAGLKENQGQKIERSTTVQCPHCHKTRLFYPKLAEMVLNCPVCGGTIPPHFQSQ